MHYPNNPGSLYPYVRPYPPHMPSPANSVGLGNRNRSITWVTTGHGHIPEGAVRAGTDVDGGRLYVCRAPHEGDLIPGKLSHTKGGAFVPWGGREISKFQYEVLVSDRVAWKYVNNPTNIPHEAVRGGQTVTGEPLYIGRAVHEGVLNPGKIHPSHRCLYMSWAGSEISAREFEVLIAY